MENMTKYYPITAIASNRYESGSMPPLCWRIPSIPSIAGVKSARTRRANRYLNIQVIILTKLVQEHRYSEAIRRFVWLLRTSRSYRTYAFNKWARGWYWKYTWSVALRKFTKFEKLCIKLPHKTPIKRTYILKADGISYRPIGSPQLEYRILNSCWAEFIYLLCIEDIEKEYNQHGFRRGKGVASAWYEVIRKSAGKGIKIYEFDLKSCFNTIAPRAVHKYLLKYDRGLAEYVTYVNQCSVAKFDEFMNEVDREYRYVEPRDVHVNKLVKGGLPQGMPWSPILASLVISQSGFNKDNVIMYADDGLIFTTKEDPLNEWLDDPGFIESGIMFSRAKSKPVIDVLKFLGAELDLNTRMLKVDGRYYFADSCDMDKLKAIFAFKDYTKRDEFDFQGWPVVENSWLWRNRTVNIWNIIKYWAFKLINAIADDFEVKEFSMRNLKRMYNDGLLVYDLLSASSQACVQLMMRHRQKARVPLVRLDQVRRRVRTMNIWYYWENNYTKIGKTQAHILSEGWTVPWLQDGYERKMWRKGFFR